MVDYNDLPLFPLHVVLFPDMPLPLHIFEPRYREMVLRCREEKSPFGVILIREGEEAGSQAIPHLIGTTARITQYEEMPDGRMNILVFGETRFRVTHASHDKPYLSAKVEPLPEETGDPQQTAPAAEAVAGLFKKYLRALFAMTGRSLSALQLPHEPAYLSYAVASVLQVPLAEKQSLLEIAGTTRRLEQEAELLRAEIKAQNALQEALGAHSESEAFILPVDTEALGRLSSLN
jgi:Lon protease-like protein